MGTIPLRDDGLGTAVTTDPCTSGCFDDPLSGTWNLFQEIPGSTGHTVVHASRPLFPKRPSERRFSSAFTKRGLTRGHHTA